jgi:hypothetical protein
MAVTANKINEWFGRRLIAGVHEQYQDGAEKIRVALETAAHTIRREVPEGAEQSRAITRLRDTLDTVSRGMKSSWS